MRGAIVEAMVVLSTSRRAKRPWTGGATSSRGSLNETSSSEAADERISVTRRARNQARTPCTSCTTPAQKPRGEATITFSPRTLNETEPSRVRHRPDRTMRVGDEVAMVAKVADVGQLSSYPVSDGVTVDLDLRGGPSSSHPVGTMWPRAMPLRLERTHRLGGEKMKLELGTSVRCADGATRELVDVVIDSSSSRVTHLVIQPAQHAEDARLVPISLASRAEKDGESEISLNCGAADLERFDPVHKFEILRAGSGRTRIRNGTSESRTSLLRQITRPPRLGDYGGSLDSDVTISYDRVPKGEIELRHAELCVLGGRAPPRVRGRGGRGR